MGWWRLPTTKQMLPVQRPSLLYASVAWTCSWLDWIKNLQLLFVPVFRCTVVTPGALCEVDSQALETRNWTDEYAYMYNVYTRIIGPCGHPWTCTGLCTSTLHTKCFGTDRTFTCKQIVILGNVYLISKEWGEDLISSNYYRVGQIPPWATSSRADLLPYLLEAVQHRHAGNTVYLTEGVQTHRVEVLLAGYLGILDDGSSWMVDYHHGMVTLYEDKEMCHEYTQT